jgi:hypothetical protein
MSDNEELDLLVEIPSPKEKEYSRGGKRAMARQSVTRVREPRSPIMSEPTIEKPSRKGKRVISEEHRAKLLKGLEKARIARARNMKIKKALVAHKKEETTTVQSTLESGSESEDDHAQGVHKARSGVHKASVHKERVVENNKFDRENKVKPRKKVVPTKIIEEQNEESDDEIVEERKPRTKGNPSKALPQIKLQRPVNKYLPETKLIDFFN